jgi:hypothetical protein
VTALGVVVRIEHDLIHCPLGSLGRLLEKLRFEGGSNEEGKELTPLETVRSRQVQNDNRGVKTSARHSN